MNKKLLLSLSFLFALLSADAQEVKRYLTFEHFTNTRCGICASRNPAFFSKLDAYSDDVHHIAFHPPVPYSNCQLYLDNPNENAGRADYYGVNGTPKVWLNGVSTGNSLVTDAQITDALALTSPIGISVTETTGDTRNVEVKVVSFEAVPDANYKLYITIAERRLNYNAPNGESVHHNVFRKYIVDGESFTAAAKGEMVVGNYSYTLDTEWGADEMYVMAYVQNDDTKEVLNSGTRFDPALPALSTSNKNLKENSNNFEVAPNPAQGQIFVNLKTAIDNNATWTLQNANGQLVWLSDQVNVNQTIDVSEYPTGIYFLSLQNGVERTVKKVVIR